jgi:transcription elongation factor GreA
MEKEPMTRAGYDKITSLLNELKTVKRPEIIIAVDEARQLGDLKENAEYHAAKEDQKNIDKTIAELEDVISRANIIDPSSLAHERVSFGSTVKVVDIDSDEEYEYSIVGGIESNPDIGLISFNSPLAKQLLGKSEGDEFKANLPGGVRELEVLEVYYKELEL